MNQQRQGFGWIALLVAYFIGACVQAEQEARIAQQLFSAARERVCR